jgi:small subunit ribosomal protein S10
MPTLHRFLDRTGYYIRGVSNGQPVALELTPEGEQYMTETLGLGDGSKFAGDTLKWLYKKQWAVTMATPPPEVPVVVVSNGREQAPAHETNPVVYPGVVQIRLAASDHVALDQSTEEVVRTLAKSGASVFGPIPLPVHVEPYTVLRDGGRKVYEIRLYQRLVQVRNPRRQTQEVMNQFALPREVDVKVEMLQNGRG